MTAELIIRISTGKSWNDPSRFASAPDVVASLSGPGDSYAHICQHITSDTGARLRKLADEADAVWADYENYKQARGRTIGEVRQ